MILASAQTNPKRFDINANLNDHCADINNSRHPENASKKDISIYLASIFWEPQDMDRAYKTLSNYAEKYSMNVLMSNYCGPSWELDSGGQSGFWDKNGKLISNLSGADPGLLIIEKNDSNWIAKTLRYK